MHPDKDTVRASSLSCRPVHKRLTEYVTCEALFVNLEAQGLGDGGAGLLLMVDKEAENNNWFIERSRDAMFVDIKERKVSPKFSCKKHS